MNGVDWKGVGIYAGLVFGVGYVAQAVLLGTGLLNLSSPGVLGSAMLLAMIAWPGAAALVASQVAPLDSEQASRMWPLPSANTFRIVLGIPAVFLVANLVLWALGWTRPDWGVSELVLAAQQRSMQPIPESAQQVLPMFLLVGSLALSTVAGATLYAAVAFLFEFGWRGYLLPKLMPLGTVPATLLAALAPFLLAAPAVVYVHVFTPEALDELPENLVRLGANMVAVGALLAGIWRQTRHLALVAIALGSIVAHAEATWDALFPASYLWFTGSSGLFIAVLWGVLALFPGVLVRKSEAPVPDSRAPSR